MTEFVVGENARESLQWSWESAGSLYHPQLFQNTPLCLLWEMLETKIWGNGSTIVCKLEKCIILQEPCVRQYVINTCWDGQILKKCQLKPNSRLFAVKDKYLLFPNFFSLCPLILTFLIQQTSKVNHFEGTTRWNLSSGLGIIHN